MAITTSPSRWDDGNSSVVCILAFLQPGAMLAAWIEDGPLLQRKRRRGREEEEKRKRRRGGGEEEETKSITTGRMFPLAPASFSVP